MIFVVRLYIRNFEGSVNEAVARVLFELGSGEDAQIITEENNNIFETLVMQH